MTECHYLFDVVDTQADFGAYKVLVLPDEAVLWPELADRIRSFIAGGGKVLATGRSGLDETESAFALELGVKHVGVNPYCPDYFRPDFTPGPLKPTAFVMYAEGQQVEMAPGGRQLGRRENPYFNRDVFAFCSHQHTPTNGEDGGPGMVESDAGIYMAWKLFSDYADNGHLILKEMANYALKRLLPEPIVETTLPARGIVTLQHQAKEQRYIQHLLYNTPVKKGRVEVIEDIVPLYNIPVTLRLPEPVKRIYLAPQGTELPFTAGSNGQTVSFTLPLLENHQMVVLDV
ncbi:Beta-galactosidase trimerization domain protein [compost metagenome]